MLSFSIAMLLHIFSLLLPVQLLIFNQEPCALNAEFQHCNAASHIFTALTCTTTIINLKPCALNAEFQHCMLRFIKMSLLCGYH
jgi:hypothetical protein